ncbi:MAG: alanine--tRNA ligase [Candidatus Bathyarchaeota archaeon]|nr:alanine--tRNA ligase [Candidatus Bathyarchaeota archaeon]
MKRFPAEEYALPFFKEEGFVRKLCPRCGEYYWTQNPKQETCGESTSDECACYSFLGDSPAKRSYSLPEMREAFLSFFEKHGHTRVKPYPVVARWRADIYLTHASIIDFQPYVTEGIAPPPANPLVIAQPCIRLVDIANTGPTFGRHLTIFEMGGHHAFNYPDREVYWKDQTVRYHHEFVTDVLGVKSEDVTYKEDVWVGGGNAGPDVECIIGGLEVGTLVFMQYKVVNDEFVKLPIRTVDTGYGLDRFAWLSQGAPSCFHAVYGGLLDKIFDMAGVTNVDGELLLRVARYSGLVSVDKTANRFNARRRVAELVDVPLDVLDKVLEPIENAFAVADHTKCLSFILSEGVVPSNIHEGYLARLMFRRVYRLLRMLDMPERLYDIMDLQVDYWGKDYPHIKTMRNEIMEMLKVEEAKFEDTIKRGEGMVKRIAAELKAKRVSRMSDETLSELYDSQGLPPEIVKQAAEAEDVQVEIPENFYALIAKRHMQATKPVEEEAEVEQALEAAVDGLQPTEQLYYVDQYMREFEAKVLKVVNGDYVVLDRTCFYPEGGGQPADHGFLAFDGAKVEVVGVQKVGRVIVHRLHGSFAPKECATVRGIIDWEKRYALMKAHTATHLINGAARRVLGEHVWQHGTQKGLECSRLDISHYRRLSSEEVHRIEVLANEAVLANLRVETAWLSRNEAESRYGFRLYQGGAVPGKEIRVVKTGDWDVEACAGTHLSSTGEIGFIKIVYTERVQDGVERLAYAVGLEALKAVQRQERLLWRVSDALNAPVEKLDKTAEKMVKDLKDANVERRRLIKELAAKESAGFGAVAASEAAVEIGGVRLVRRDFGEMIDVNRMVETASKVIERDEAAVAVFYGADGKTARVLVMAGKAAVAKGVNAGEVVRMVSPVIGGGGGGRVNFAQGGGTQPEKLQEAIARAEDVIRKQLQH